MIVDTDSLRAAADVLDRMGELTDASDLAHLAAETRVMLDGAASALTRAREAAAAKLARSGLSMSQVGTALGVSKQRAHVLASAGMRQGWGETGGRADAGGDARAEYDAYLEAAYLAAEQATRGQMVRAEYRATVDPKSFYWRRGPLRMSAVSDELHEHWQTGEFGANTAHDGAPLSFTEWQTVTREQHPDAHA